MRPNQDMIFSVIIPTYNRSQALERCLRALEKQKIAPGSYEIIVVNDGGESLQHVKAGLSGAVTISFLEQKNAGPATARNAGAAVARGHYLVFTDDDCAPDQQWLARFEQAFAAAPPRSLVGGRTVNALTQNAYACASQLLVDYLYAFYARKKPDALFYTSNNMAMSKDGFGGIGGFNQSFPSAAGEDREFAVRWTQHGGHMEYVPQAVNYHYHQMTFAKYFRQHFNYGKGARLFYQYTGAAQGKKVRVKVLPFSFYAQLFLYPWKLRQSPSRRNAALSGLLFISQFANALGYFAKSKRLKSTFKSK